MSLLIELLVKYIIEPFLDRFLKPLVENILRTHFTWLHFGVFGIIFILGLLLFNLQNLLYAYQANEKDLSLVDQDIKIVDTYIRELEKRVSDEIITLDPTLGMASNNSWLASQGVLALKGENDFEKVDTALYFDFIQGIQSTKCFCWAETPKGDIHLGASAWTLLATASMGRMLHDSTIDFYIQNQFKTGSWPMYATNMENYGSTYSTSYMVLALHYALKNQKVFPSSKRKVQRAINKAKDWVLQSQTVDFKWKDYPNLSMKSKESFHLSAIVIHMLHELGLLDREMGKDFYNLLDFEQKDFLQPESNVVFYQDGDNKDQTRYLHIWEVMAVIDIYPYLGFKEKYTVLKWMSSLLHNLDHNKVMMSEAWVQAELLIIMKRLKGEHIM
jgi:hypothetical protein